MGIGVVLGRKLLDRVFGGVAFSAGSSLSLQLWGTDGNQLSYTGYAAQTRSRNTTDWSAAQTVSNRGEISPASLPTFPAPTALSSPQYPAVELRIYDGSDLWWRCSFGTLQTGAIDASGTAGDATVVIDNGSGANLTTTPVVNGAFHLNSDPHTIYRITSVTPGANEVTLGISPNLAVNVADSDGVTFLRTITPSVGDAINITSLTLRLSEVSGGGLSNALELALLNLAFRGAAYTPTATVFVDIYSTAPSVQDGTEGTLTNYTSYAQGQITNNTTNWPNATASGAHAVKSLGVQFNFATPTGNAGADVVALALWFETGRTNLLAVLPFDAKPIQSGDSVFIPTGERLRIRAF